MRIKKLLIRLCDIPFKISFSQFTNTRHSSQGLLAELITDKGIIGYGECLPREYVSGETISGVVDGIKIMHHELMEQEFEDLEDLAAWFDYFEKSLIAKGYLSSCARCLLETALFDALGKTVGKPLIDLLGGQQIEEIYYSGIVAGGKKSINQKLIEFSEVMNFRQIKIKVGLNSESDLELIRMAKSYLKSEVELRVDVNGAWSYNQATEMIALFEKEGIYSFEQPLHKRDQEQYPQLLNAVPPNIKIWVDESVCTLEDAEWFVHHRAATGINLKISKNGGILNCRAISKMARENQISCQLGAQVGETSLLASAGLALAAVEGDFSYHEGAFSKYLLHHDIVDHPLDFKEEGLAQIKDITRLPGLGIEINPQLANQLPLMVECRSSGKN